MMCVSLTPTELQALSVVFFLTGFVGVLAAFVLRWGFDLIADSTTVQDWRDRQYVRQLNKKRGVSSPTALVVLAVVCFVAACAFNDAPPPLTGSGQWWAKVKAQPW